MKGLHEIRISDYTYDLPEHRIAQFPLAQRDASKLLLFQDGIIHHHRFEEIAHVLPAENLLVFNNSKVIHARLHMYRKTGAKIEILLLSPVSPATVDQAMQSLGSTTWKCIIGGKKKWKDKEVLEQEWVFQGEEVLLQAELIDRQKDHVLLSWNSPKLPFSDLLSSIGKLPLPPYLKREVKASDEQQYQTVYAQAEGAVAAPTAGLHFSEKILRRLGAKGVETEYVTLHVSAGTFLPVKADQVIDHNMHQEQFILKKPSIEKFLESREHIVLVGTTSMRVVESLYWLALQVWENPEKFSAQHLFHIGKTEPYEYSGELPSPQEVLSALLSFMEKKQLTQIQGSTSIMIMPGYSFKLSRGLITNFHMPDTTLLLLVAAFIGEDWRKVYQAALDNEYRFLSYGDSSLLLPSNT